MKHLFAALVMSVGAGIRDTGFAFAKDALPKVMKDPASTTVDPASVSHQYLFDTKDGQTGETISVYLVQGEVRSKNSFNAIVPCEWFVLVAEREKSVEVSAVHLGEKQIFITELGKELWSLIHKKTAVLNAKEWTQAMAADAGYAQGNLVDQFVVGSVAGIATAAQYT